MALKEYIGLARLTQAFSLLKSKLDGKEDTPTVISYDDFMELTPEQQMTGSYIVVGGTPMTDAYGISYKTNKTVGDALDDHADAIDELNADIIGVISYPKAVTITVDDLVKHNGVVDVTINVKPQVAVNQYETIAVLPVGFRPREAKYIQFSGKGFAINTNGTVLALDSYAINADMTFSCCFIAN